MTKVALQINKMCLAGLFLALGWLMPFLTGQIQEFGNMLLPMHIPVMLCGFILGPVYGALIGFITPLTRSLIFGMPPLVPTALAMSFELMTYGLICGLFFYLINRLFKKVPTIVNVYISLVSAMIIGRGIWGLMFYLINFGAQNPVNFDFMYFVSGAFITAWPGIIVQLVLIPALIQLLYSTKMINNLMPDYARIFKGFKNKKDQVLVTDNGPINKENNNEDK